MDRAAVAGIADKLRVRLTLKTETRTNLKAENAVAVVPGKSDEVIILNAHVDGWFDGAGDNADGLAVMVALARHFAKPENRPERTLVFVASAGHHSPGHERTAQLRRRQSRAREEGGDDGQHRARRAAQLLAGAKHGGRRLPPGGRRFGRGADLRGHHQPVAVSRQPGPAGRRPLRHQLHLGEVEHVERRDRRLLSAQGRGL